MAIKNKIVSLDDLLLVTRATGAEYGVDRIQATIENEIAYTNAQVQKMVSEMCEMTTAQIHPWGGHTGEAWQQLTELGQADPRDEDVGINASVPLKRWGHSIGFTIKAFETKSVADLTRRFIAAQEGYQLTIKREIKKAIFTSASSTWTDSLYNNIALTVYPFANGDATKIPNSPAGVSFSNHNHYLGSSTFTPAAIFDLVSEISEHGNTRGMQLYCSLSDVTNFTSASTGFTKLPDEATQTLLTKLVSGEASSLVNSDYENKLIGYWDGGVPVNVRDWVPANYYVLMSLGMGEKPLLYRQLPSASMQGLRLDPMFKDSPIYAQEMESLFGVAPYNRVMASVLYVGSASYVQPTIT